MKNIKELMKWRFACKQFEAGKEISEEILEDLLDTTRLSPSSSGLQAWKFIVITNAELLNKLYPVCHNQSQIKEASAIVFCCARTDLEGENGVIANYAQLYQEENNKTDEETEKFAEKLHKTIAGKDDYWKKCWVEKQVYIAVQVLMMAAAEKAIDSCPMEGFDVEGVAKILDLPDYVHPTVMVSLGYRKIEQPKKVRFPLGKIMEIRN